MDLEMVFGCPVLVFGTNTVDLDYDDKSLFFNRFTSHLHYQSLLPVLSVRPKITDLNFHLYAQSVHPELFDVCARRTTQRDRYELETAITTDGHAIRFQCGSLSLTEVGAGLHHPLPTKSLLLTQQIDSGNRHQLRIQDLVDYQCSVQIETVNPKLFVALQQQLNNRVECEGLVHRFGSNGRLAFGAMSYIHVQSFLEHVLIRSFHTFPESSSVVTSESRFSVAEG